MGKFMMTVGPSGSGKTTVAASLGSENTLRLSSDGLRAELWGDPNDQRNPGKIFGEMLRRTLQALEEGRDVVYDATNLNSKKRAALLKKLNDQIPDLRTEVHLVLADPDLCIERQKTRDRRVPDGVIRRQAAEFELPGRDEGWTEPIRVHNPTFSPGTLSDYVERTRGVSQLGPWHQETVDMHHAMVAEYARSHGFSPVICEIAAVHDLGKPGTRTVDDKGNTHFYGHERLGTYLYLCATAPTGELSQETWHRAALIAHHMDPTRSVSPERSRAAVGEDLYEEILLFHQADEHGAIRWEQLKTMSVLEFMNTFYDWEERIRKAPFCVTVKRDGDYVLLQYQTLNSDMTLRIAQESRGSIFAREEDGQWRYVCRPFDKFFNYGQPEAAELDWTTARVLEKVDGSLIKLFFHRGEWHLATNGTIDAFKAPVSDLGYSFGTVFNRALNADYKTLGDVLDPEYTYLFELTSPDTRLVVPYPDGIWYLSRRHTQTGAEDFRRPDLPGVRFPKEYSMRRLEEVLAAVAQMPKEEEGVVVNDAKGRRIKIKSPEYLIAAHFSNNKAVSNRNLVDYMKNGTLDDFLGYCPHYADRVQDLLKRFQRICAQLDEEWHRYEGLRHQPRPRFAAAVKDSPYKAYLFLKLGQPELTAEAFLRNQPTARLLGILGLKTTE